MNDLFIQGLTIDWNRVRPYNYVRQIPAISGIDTFTFHKPITFFVGENGSGKSTLLEAIAVAYGFNAEGGTKNYSFSTYNSHSELCEAMTISKGYRRPKFGYFLRAESFYNVATKEIDYSDDDHPSKGYDQKSHGESFLAIAQDYMGADGVYIFDEPEAALSPQRQLTLLINIYRCAQEGAQFIIVSHDKDAITVKEVFRSNLLSQENALGKVKVTGFLRREWVAKSQKLWAEGNSIYLAGQGGDGTHHQTKYLREEDYLPIGIIVKLDGRDFRVDHVNFMFKSVSLQDMDLTNSGQPIFRVERLPNIRELYEQQQDEIIDVSPEKAVDYKVGDEVVVDLPTRTIEGKIGYVGETDVRIDTSAHGQSWDNEVLNKQQFEDGLRRDEPTPDEELDKLPISVEVNGEWQTFPDAAAADEALNAEPIPEAAGNFHITDDNLGVGGPKQKFARNIEAIQTLRTLEQEHRGATAEEQQVLSQYVGWGGLADVFDPNKENWSAEYTQLKGLLTEEEYAAARASTLNAHYALLGWYNSVCSNISLQCDCNYKDRYHRRYSN